MVTLDEIEVLEAVKSPEPWLESFKSAIILLIPWGLIQTSSTLFF
jgi:hypothetical protein